MKSTQFLKEHAKHVVPNILEKVRKKKAQKRHFNRRRYYQMKGNLPWVSFSAAESVKSNNIESRFRKKWIGEKPLLRGSSVSSTSMATISSGRGIQHNLGEFDEGKVDKSPAPRY